MWASPSELSRKKCARITLVFHLTPCALQGLNQKGLVNRRRLHGEISVCMDTWMHGGRMDGWMEGREEQQGMDTFLASEFLTHLTYHDSSRVKNNTNQIIFF